MKKIGFFLAKFLTVALFFGCGDEVTKTVAGESRAFDLDVVAETDSLPVCKADDLGKMVLVSSRNAVYVCADSGWTPLTPSTAERHSCELVPLSDGSGSKIVCDGDSLGVVRNGKDGRDGADGATGEAGEDGQDCRSADNGDGSYWRICGEDSVMFYKALCRDVPYDPDSTLCDSRNMRVYRTVKIGDRVWMAENLAYVEYFDDYQWDIETFGRCYEDKNENCRQFGGLYKNRAWSDYPERVCYDDDYDCDFIGDNFCPVGWHLPDSTEWNVLFAEAMKYSGEEVFIGALLSKDEAENVYGLFPVTDTLGFGVLFAGLQNNNDFKGLFSATCFQSAESNIFLTAKGLSYAPRTDGSLGCSIRCIRDRG